MSPERWQKVKAILSAAMECKVEERSNFLAQACGSDTELRKEVETLLIASDKASDFIEEPALSKPFDALSEQEDGAVGRTVGAYRLVRKIAHGGMGTVYLGARADDAFQKQVAVKLVGGGLYTKSILERFAHERQILASLEHPNIARLIDGGTTADGLSYFVMEYVEGIPIDQFCEQRQLNIVERLRLFTKVCAAVHYAHQNLVVHRDIKPSNILVTADGEPKLLDFGIAKLLRAEPSEPSSEMTRPEQRILTPEYASPEQICGGAITTSSDVYSLGVLLYKLLTGRQPYYFRQQSLAEIERVVCEQEPEKPSDAVLHEQPTASSETVSSSGPQTNSVSETTTKIAPRQRGEIGQLRRRLAGDLDRIVLTALRREPQRRYASVEQFKHDIERHLNGLPVLAQPDTFHYRASKFIRRHKMGVGVATLILIMLLGGTGATAWQARVARAERRRADQRFNDVRQLANSFMFEFHDAIQNLPGSTPARKLVVAKALQYLDNLSQDAHLDTSLQSELATAYLKIGDVQGNPYNANLGDLGGALQSYQKAQTILEGLVAKDPGNSRLKIELAQSYERVGDMLSMTNDVEGALEKQKQALEIRKELLAAEPHNRELNRDVAMSYNKLGDTLGWLGKASEALASHRQSLNIAESIPDYADMSRSQIKIGDTLAALEDTEGALQSYQAAIKSAERVLVAEPSNTKVRRLRAMSYDKIGERLVATNDTTRALDYHRQALKLREELVTADPANAQANRDLAVSYSTLGEALLLAEKPSDALQAARQALKTFQSLVDFDPTNAGAREDLALMNNKVGKLLLGAHDPLAASEHFQKAQDILKPICDADPSNVEAQRALASSYQQQGDAYILLAQQSSNMQTEYQQRGCRIYQQSLKIISNLQRANQLPETVAKGLLDQLQQKIEKCST